MRLLNNLIYHLHIESKMAEKTKYSGHHTVFIRATVTAHLARTTSHELR